MLIPSCSKPQREISRVRIIITGNLKGAFRSCHCPNGQPGGLARRKTIVDMLKREATNAILLDCGFLYRTSMDADEKTYFADMINSFGYYACCNSDSIDGHTQSFSLPGISGYSLLIKNISETEDERLAEADYETDFYKEFAAYDLVIMGGGGFVKPEVVERGSTLFAYPGTFGSHVLYLDLSFNQKKDLITYDWKALPTKGVEADSALQSKIELFYKTMSKRTVAE